MNTQPNQPLTLQRALGQATVAEKCHLARLHAELQELKREGVYVSVTADELYLLERVGMTYDFGSGTVNVNGGAI